MLGPVTDSSTVSRSGRAPDWFLDALATRPERRTTRVSGVPISYLAWGPPDAPGLVLVHGGGAHAQWWDHIAPAFSADRRVLALDLSGHGWSGHRDGYSLDGWTDELLAVAAHGDLCGPPVLVGHSMGGFVTIAAAANHGDEVAGVIVCDSPVTSLDPELSPAAHFGTERKVYPSIEDSLARFRTVPAQDRYLPYVLDHVARASLEAVEGGWTWRFDRRVFGEFAEQIRSIALPHLARVRCPFTLLRSQYGLVTPGIGAAMQSVLPGGASVVELPGAGHHAMLDEPLVLIAALRAVLGEWSRTSGSS